MLLVTTKHSTPSSFPSNMESPNPPNIATTSPNTESDEQPRLAKFLCSFGGSILPRPLDGQLRYVGGETRIVTVPHDISFPNLLSRMREIFSGADVIKYQQLDEELDSLVSVVNDDDVVNMMEEYDKLVSCGEAFTRLRIFLFSHLEGESSSPSPCFVDGGNERENERRYVDALNSLHLPDSEGSNGMTGNISLKHLNVPWQGYGQRFADMDCPWGGSYFSPPGFYGPHDQREFPPSPSGTVRFHIGGEEVSENYAQSPLQVESNVWLPPGAAVQEKSGFPCNLARPDNFFDGNINNTTTNICEQCHVAAYRRSQGYIEPPSRWRMNEYSASGPQACAQCCHNRDLHIENEHYYHNIYNDSHVHDRAWAMHSNNSTNQFNQRYDDPRAHRVQDPYVADGSTVNLGNFPYLQGNFHDSHDNSCYFNHPGAELSGNEKMFYAPQVAAGTGGVTVQNYSQNPTGAYNLESLYQVPHNLPPIPSLRRKLQMQVPVPIPVHASASASPYESPDGGIINPSLVRNTPNGSPQLTGPSPFDRVQSPWQAHNEIIPQKIAGLDLHPKVQAQDYPLQCQPAIPITVTPAAERVVLAELAPLGPVDDSSKEATELTPGVDLPGVRTGDELSTEAVPNDKKPTDNGPGSDNVEENGEVSKEGVSLLPELITSVKKATLEGADMAVTDIPAQLNDDGSKLNDVEPEKVGAEPETDLQGCDEPAQVSKIEPTTAEAEALAKGLQTIKNDDLEEVKELGTGTYGAVYHGKWKGSDVAIKRIKSSCFAGRPSERERLIADFWKEALILSSLHHPNVVSFYGVVRNGPDGSLATVTEFMVNGSLKQFLQKKDRTIDRRKRLIIAMDAAFGMEYLHGKNIVHFDLKCENLLVNMRDPHRPICKIGDLGLSKVKQHTLVSGGVRGTLPWMAPELLSGKSNMVSEKIDVYSFGIVMWELLTGDEPYSDLRCASIIGGIVNNTLRPQIPTWCDPEWKSLMESCWSSDPSERPSFSDISQKLRKMAAAINVK